MNQLVFQIVVTLLLSILTALATWALKSIIKQREDADRRHLRLTESLAVQHQDLSLKIAAINQQIWGRDGTNGHASELRELRRSFRRIERYIERLGYRTHRLEERAGIKSGEHEKFRASDDDAEDDRRG